MRNLKGLQMGGAPSSEQEIMQIAEEIKNSVQAGVQSIESVVFDILDSGQDANNVGMALMQLGYEEEDVISLFESIAQSQQPQQEQPQQEQQMQQMQQMMGQEMMEDAPVARMGMQMMSNKKKDSFKDWYKQLGGGTHNTHYAQKGYQVPGQEYMDMEEYGNNLTNMGIVGDTYDNLYEATDERNTQAFNDAYDFSEDLSQSNVVNKGSMGIQPSTGYEGPDGLKKKKKKIKNPFTTAVQGINILNDLISSEGNPNDYYNDLTADNLYTPSVNKLSRGKDDANTGKDFSGQRVPYIGFGQAGMEMSMQANSYLDKIKSDYLPIYQSQGEIPNMATLKEMYKMFGKTDNNLINVDNVSGLDAKRKVASVNRAIIESRGSVSTPETFVRDRMGRPDAKVEYIYTQDSKTPDALETPMQIPDQKLQEYYAKIMQQEQQMQDKPGVTSGDRYTGYTGPMFPDGITLPKNQSGREFVEKEFGNTDNNIIRKRYETNPYYKPTERELKEIDQYYYDLFMQDKRLKEKNSVTSGQGLSPEMRAALNRGYGERTNKKYGGSSNPFSKKRQLRKKRGGQIAKVGTEVLKKLMAKGAKFNML